MNYFFDMILYFTFYSFAGWCLETLFALFQHRRWVKRGFLKGPFCPIYGFGGIIIMLSSDWVDNLGVNLQVSMIFKFIIIFVLISLLEYMTGLLLTLVFNKKWWDYSDNLFNVGGHICLKYSLLWAASALLLIDFIHPQVVMVINSYEHNDMIFWYLYMSIMFYFALDTVVSMMDVLDLSNIIQNYSITSPFMFELKIKEYQRFFYTFPRLMVTNYENINKELRRIFHDQIYKIKDGFRSMH